MPSMQVIKRRISSVRDTQQITKAMDLVSASKLQKIKARYDKASLFFKESMRVMDNLRNNECVAENILIKPRPIRNSAYVVITSDRGLCGGYNINVAKEALSFIDAGENEKIIAVGLKGWDYLRKKRKNILYRFTGVSGTAFYEDAEAVGSILMNLYMSGGIDEAYVAYTRFESTLSHVPVVEKILPIGSSPDSQHKYDRVEYDPDANTVLERLAPVYINVFICSAMMESSLCEQAARMVSMDSATSNANEIIDDLTLVYNRIRQDAITQELNEIVGGANALK